MLKEKQKTVRKTYLLSEVLDKKLSEIQEKLGLRTSTGAIEYCINSTHKKEI
jgi:hypothetical protein